MARLLWNLHFYTFNAGEPTNDSTDTTDVITQPPGGSIVDVTVVVVVVVVVLTIMAVIITIILTIFIMKRRKFTIPRMIESNEFEVIMTQGCNDDPIEKTSNTGFSGGGVMHEELDAESTHKAPVGNGKVFVDAIPDADYAVVDKKPSPNVPSKSPALQQYLETSPITTSTTTATATTSTAAVAAAAATAAITTAKTAATAATIVTGQEGQSKIVTLSRSIVSNSALSDNPEYAPIGESNPVYSTANSPVYAIPDHVADAGMENMYAELGLPTSVQEPNPSDNIYECICNEEFLSPSSFNEGSFPSRTDNPEDLYHYSPIYSVPVVAETEVVQPLEVTSHNIEEVRDLGTGNFGAVLLAKTVGLSHRELCIGNSTDTSVSVLVAVKKLKANANVGARNLFDKECKFMSRLNDPNVVRLLCVCKLGPVPFLVMEYMEHGDLNQYLQKHHKVVHGEGGSSAGEGEITQQKLIVICTQIASGMKYLTTNNFVHRDLATRNCLVNEDYDVKIADFGMSRNLYDSHYYVIKGQAVLPIRWMASECFYGQFSAKTDVWAFGATMWEVFELAKHEPYYEMLDREVVMDACKKENRTILSRPAECPEEVYQIMLRCWPHLASERATFEELEKSLLFLPNCMII